jgi:hypothetical protein
MTGKDDRPHGVRAVADGTDTAVFLEELRELKVRLPARLLLKLHVAKLQAQRPIAELVAIAIDEFFERNPDIGQVPTRIDSLGERNGQS